MTKRGPKGITLETARTIRRLYDEGHTQQAVADRFGLSQSAVCKIVNHYIHKDTASGVTVGGSAIVSVVYHHKAGVC